MLTLTMARSDAEILDLLSVATADVYWVSESDEPFEVVLWPDLVAQSIDAETLRQQLSVTDNVAIQTQAIADFFQPTMTLQDWHREAEKMTIGQYEQLLFMLQQYLTDLQVFRVGEGEVEIYIVGKTPAEHWLALKTLAVET